MAQAGRGGGGAKGGQGGAGREGSGAGSTGGRDAAMGGGGRGVSGGGGGRQVYSSPIGPTKTGEPMGAGQHYSQKGTGFGGFLDSVLGYENVGQRVNAYNNNPNRPGGKFSGFTGMIPSFPQAGIGYGLLALAGAPMGPVGFATRIGDIALGGTGHGMFADAFGGGPGKRGPDVGGGGTERGGRGQAGYQLPLGYMMQQPTPQNTAPTVNLQPQVQTPPLSRVNRSPVSLSPFPGYGANLPGYGYYK